MQKVLTLSWWNLLFFAAGWVGVGAEGLAQSVIRAPDGGAIQQQIERDRQPQSPVSNSLSDGGVLAKLPNVEDGTVVVVQRFRFQGNTLISSELLAQLLQDSAGRRLSFAQLQMAVQNVMQSYRDAGWMAYAFLPEQDVTSGEVTIRILEATMGELELRADSQLRISEEHIREIFNAYQTQGEALGIDALDRALLLVGDLPGVNIKGGLSEWTAGSSVRNVVVEAMGSPLASGQAVADNTGSRSTGENRASVNLNLNSALGWGDLLALTAMQTEGSTYLRSGISFPIGYQGLRVSMYDAYLRYRIVSPEFQAADSKGSSNTLGVSASYPLVRSPMRNLYANFLAERKVFDNQANGDTVSKYKSTDIDVSLSGNSNDAWGGLNSGSLSWVHGLLDLNSSPTQSSDSTSTQTAGVFEKLRYSLTREQPLSSSVTGYAALSGQLSSKNLDSSEKFILGGDTGVRAYPSSEGMGDQGQLVSLELRWRNSETSTLSVFYDWGHITLLRNSTDASSLNDYAIKGAGLSWVKALPGGASLKLSWAQRIGSNPNASFTGTDQDGSLIKDRYWLSLSLPFTF